MSSFGDHMQPPSARAVRTGSFPTYLYPREHHLNAQNGPFQYPPDGRTGSFPHHLHEAAPTSEYSPGEQRSSLTVVDNRTGRCYDLPVAQNSIKATDFQQIKTPRNEKNPVEQNNSGIRIFDPGFQNTACMQSEITYVDGDAGEIAYRGTPVADLFFSGRPFEHVAFLLIFGHLPNDSEAVAFNTSIATSEMPPQAIFDTINNLP
jgi:citrate synthase